MKIVGTAIRELEELSTFLKLHAHQNQSKNATIIFLLVIVMMNYSLRAWTLAATQRAINNNKELLPVSTRPSNFLYYSFHITQSLPNVYNCQISIVFK